MRGTQAVEPGRIRMTRTTAPAVTSLVSRRTFVQGLAGSALLLPVAGGTTATASDAVTLTGTDFELAIGTVTVDLTGRRRSATLVNGRLPGPVLRWREGMSSQCASPIICRCRPPSTGTA